jgi:mannose-1-phosphate guanylyltransferase
MNVTGVIMAGGRGERFWPLSRQSMPKQFLSLQSDGKTMIQSTFERLSKLSADEDIFVVTNQDYREIVKNQLPAMTPSNILAEPVGKNTTACIGLAAVYIEKKYGDSVMICCPSDHSIKGTDAFVKTIRDAAEAAEEGSNIVTIGIMPDYPETGYGYIKFKPGEYFRDKENISRVERFVEKPTVEKAREYINNGNYLWNSGIFVWKTSTILSCIKKLLPAMYDGLMRIKDAFGTDAESEVLEREFRAFPSISVDYGIMEHVSDVYTIPCTFGWDDVGSWSAIGRINDSDENGNITLGNAVLHETSDTILYGGAKLIAAVGVKNLVIVDTDDAILVCEKSSAQNVKKIIESLNAQNKTQYL